MMQTETVVGTPPLSADETYAEVVRLAAAQVGADARSVTAQTHFQNDLGYDSLDLVEYTMALEERFDIAITDAEADSIRNVGAAFEKVRALLAGRA